MSDMETAINPDTIDKTEFNDAKLDPRASQEIMDYLLNHYLTMQKIVEKKLGHTRAAIQQSIKAIKKAWENNEINSDVNIIERLQNIDEAICSLMPVGGFLLDELERIDEILENISDIIKSRSDELIGEDQALAAMIEKITGEEYQVAYQSARKVAGKIHSGNNLLSGLSRQEYEENYKQPKPDKSRKEKPGKKRDDDMGYMVTPDGKKVKIL